MNPAKRLCWQIMLFASLSPNFLKSQGNVFVWFDSLRPSQKTFSYVRTGLSRMNQYSAGINVPCLRTQGSAASEAQTRNPSTMSQALYQGATASPQGIMWSPPFVCYAIWSRTNHTCWVITYI